MNNVNIDLEIENLIIYFSVNKKKSIINIKSVKSNYCINFAIFKYNKINEIFSEFYYNNVNKYNENCFYIFAIVIL